MKVSLSVEAVTYDIANDLGEQLRQKGKFEEDKKTLISLHNMGLGLDLMKDYEGALEYCQQALRGKEKVLVKTFPDTLTTIYNMTCAYHKGLNHLTKAEEMHKLPLKAYERSLGKEHKDTKVCARNLGVLYAQNMKSIEKTIELAKRHPHMSTEILCVHNLLRGDGK